MAIKSEIFIDKTEMIDYLNTVVNTNQRFVSVSRPRRFGKTLAADMLCAYYAYEEDSREMFEQCKLSKSVKKDNELQWDAYLGKFDVLRLVMTEFFDKRMSFDKSMEKMQKLVCRDIKKIYPDVDYFDDADLLQTLADVYTDNKRQLVIVIDEWDAVFRTDNTNKKEQTEYLDFLRDLMKDKSYIALAYMTGILPIKKYGKHSALNMFTEYSMMYPRRLAPFTGFTEAEVRELCVKYHMSYDEIKDWYDGYVVSDTIPLDKREEFREGKYSGHKTALYSPLSVVEAMLNGDIKNYWNKTETYEALAEYIKKDYDGLQEAVTLLMDGAKIRIDTSTYQNDMTTFYGRDDVLSLLVHLGYLGYDDETGEVYIPNKEILDEFRSSTKSSEWTSRFRSLEISQELLQATWEKDADRVAELIEKAHDLAGNKTYNDEAALSYAIQYAYYAAERYYTTILELDSGKGYADIVFLPSPKFTDKPALLVELKYEKDAVTALSQIKKQRYPERLRHYKGNILLVGINYEKGQSPKQEGFKHHSCVIENA